MTDWPHNPRIYEINTWVWLNTLTQLYNTPITLQNIPEEVIDELASYYIDSIWLMGVWYRGTKNRASALNYVHEYQHALPNVTESDVQGSAYAIGAYDVQEEIGGREGLAKFRHQLHQRGLKLILDFVPNHTGLDHPWIQENPDYYVNASDDWLKKAKGEFFRSKTAWGEGRIIAHGRDPYFPGWIDTAQLNAYHPGYRQGAVKTLRDIASLCDGVRCDMAMLMLNDIFKQTWGWLHPDLEAPAVDFWQYVIPKVRDLHPNFLFIAEAYWNLNYVLLEQGFNFTYDKTLYDRMLAGDVNGIYTHLHADLGYLKRQIRFIENHDEPRAAESFGIERSRTAATLIATLPGALLLHHGQFSGRKIKLPVQITRQPYERDYPALREFYQRLLEEADDEIYRHGQWRMFRCYTACEGCEGDYNIVAYGWRHEEDIRVIVLNLSNEWSQGIIDLEDWGQRFQGQDWRLLDVLHHTFREEFGSELADEGLRIDIEPHQALIYQFVPMKKRKIRSALASRAL